MKRLVLIAVLMSFSWMAQAKGWQHSYYERGHDVYSFWQEVDGRQFNQQERIDRGVDRGQLTRREAKRLYREQKKVNRLIRHYKRQKYLSSDKKREVMECLNITSEKIRRFKFNDRYAYRGNDDRNNMGYKIERNYNKDWNPGYNRRNNIYL